MRDEQKTFTDEDFHEILKYIWQLIKDCKKEKKNVEEAFLHTMMGF